MTAQMAERHNHASHNHASHNHASHNHASHNHASHNQSRDSRFGHNQARHNQARDPQPGNLRARDNQSQRDTTPRTPRHDEPERMPLRTDLFLIAHDQNTGQPYLPKHSIAIGLAAAVLVELWYAGRVRLGWHGNPNHCTWERNHTQVTLIDASATGDQINDSALVLLWRMGGTVNTNQFIQEFATTDLYEAVRDHLTHNRILHISTRRRFWFFKQEIRRPRNAAYPVKARARIRNVACLYRPRNKDTMLAALVTALGLAPYFHFIDHSTGGVRIQLAEHIGPEHPIHDITKAIAPYRLRFQ